MKGINFLKKPIDDISLFVRIRDARYYQMQIYRACYVFPQDRKKKQEGYKSIREWRASLNAADKSKKCNSNQPTKD